jgi:hypothetical protein
MTVADEIATVEQEEEEEEEETEQINETAENNVRFAKQRAGQASTWQHISKHKIRDTTIFLPGFKTIT